MRGGIAFVLLLAACDCPTGQTRCVIGPPPGQAVCTDTATDTINCGGCNHHCPGGYTCTGGKCVACTLTCKPNEVLDKSACKCTCPTRSCGADCCGPGDTQCCGSQCCSDLAHCSLTGCCRSLVCNRQCCGDLSLTRCCTDGNCPSGGHCDGCIDTNYYYCGYGDVCCPFGQECCGANSCCNPGFRCRGGLCLPEGIPAPPSGQPTSRPAGKRAAPVK